MKYDKQITLNMSLDQMDWLERTAENNGVSRAEIVRCMINMYIKEGL